eukprot:6183165-Pleurochrysis_carterae.AAC.4
MLLLGDLDWATIRGGQGEASRFTTRQATVRKRARARMLGSPTEVASGRGRSGDVGHACYGTPEPG